MYVYKTTNMKNGKMYVGQDGRETPYYLGGGLRLRKDVKKYGTKNFIKDILFRSENKKEIDRMEEYWISYFQSIYGDDCYNITNKAKYFYKGHSNNKGISFTEKHKNNLSIAMKGNKNMLGKTWSQEIKDKISNTLKGKMAGHKHPNYKGGVLCLDTGIKYKSVTEVSKKLNLCQSKVYAVMNGERKKTGGLSFEWIDKYIEN